MIQTGTVIRLDYENEMGTIITNNGVEIEFASKDVINKGFSELGVGKLVKYSDDTEHFWVNIFVPDGAVNTESEKLENARQEADQKSGVKPKFLYGQIINIDDTASDGTKKYTIQCSTGKIYAPKLNISTEFDIGNYVKFLLPNGKVESLTFVPIDLYNNQREENDSGEVKTSGVAQKQVSQDPQMAMFTRDTSIKEKPSKKDKPAKSDKKEDGISSIIVKVALAAGLYWAYSEGYLDGIIRDLFTGLPPVSEADCTFLESQFEGKTIKNSLGMNITYNNITNVREISRSGTELICFGDTIFLGSEISVELKYYEDGEMMWSTITPR